MSLEGRIARFWARVDKTPYCWVWRGKRRAEGPYRFSWEIHHGAIPEGMLVRHAVCDNRSCVNPAHLALGTRADNLHDMVHGGRHLKKARRRNYSDNRTPRSVVVTGARVQDIRRRWDTELVTASELAGDYHMTSVTIHHIVRWETWKDLPRGNWPKLVLRGIVPGEASWRPRYLPDCERVLLSLIHLRAIAGLESDNALHAALDNVRDHLNKIRLDKRIGLIRW